MKRTLLVAALAAASVSAYAADPQPSFQDNAPVQSQPATSDTAIARKALPQPSFNDNATIGSQQVVTSGSVATIPAPSFAG